MRSDSYDTAPIESVERLAHSGSAPVLRGDPLTKNSPSQRNKIPQVSVQEQLLTAVREAIRAEFVSRRELPDRSDSSVRAAVRAELEDMIADSGPWREAIRTDLATALKGCGSVPPLASPKELTETPPNRVVSRESHGLRQKQKSKASLQSLAEAAGSANIEDRHRVAAGEHFMSFMNAAARFEEEIAETHLLSWLRVGDDSTLWRKVDSWYLWLMTIEEPERNGRLAHVVDSKGFEIVVCIAILLNILFMIYSANSSIQRPQDRNDLMLAGDWIFQVFYTIELFMRLMVHRTFYVFFNVHWRLNLFDIFLVLSGYVTILFGHSGMISGTFLRVLRLAKFGKALRVVRIMAQLKHLRKFLVCLQGSFENFFWSVVMLCMVFLLFALFLMQMITVHLEETSSDFGGEFEALFGTVPASMLTLYEVATGGDDWKNVYNVIREAGGIAATIFLVYIAFVQLALINIITGIFVESAMMTLTPDRETVALELAHQEKEYAKDLERLCINVDADSSGKLTREQFEDGMRKGRIPTLLTLLGLSRHHVLEFFNTMSSLSAQDNGEVNIKHFVEGCMKLKGPATNFDLQTLHSQMSCFERTVESAMERMDLRMQELELLGDPAN